MDTNPSALPAQMQGQLRAGLAFVGGILVSKGLIAADQVPALVGFGTLAAGALWSWWSHRQANKALKAAIAAPAGQAS